VTNKVSSTTRYFFHIARKANISSPFDLSDSAVLSAFLRWDSEAASEPALLSTLLPVIQELLIGRAQLSVGDFDRFSIGLLENGDAVGKRDQVATGFEPVTFGSGGLWSRGQSSVNVVL
jgi:hypothetical protein